jgi:hypothetical protein
VQLPLAVEGLRPLLIENTGPGYAKCLWNTAKNSERVGCKTAPVVVGCFGKAWRISFWRKGCVCEYAGGLRIEDPSTDLAIICALLSSYDDTPLSSNICFAGEVGLNGEIRAVNRVEQRIAEAEKLGFEKIIISPFNKKALNKTQYKIDVTAISKVDEFIQAFILILVFQLLAMSLIKNYFDDFLHLFFPHICIGCDTDVVNHDDVLCAKCISNLPEPASYRGWKPGGKNFLWKVEYSKCRECFLFQ